MINEVLEFAREYINDRHRRTPERKAKIEQALRELTGENVRRSCGTCYIEALIKIRTIMATANYELKRGYVASFDNGAYKEIKAFTNNELTDELAAEYLRQFPSRIVYFSRLPGTVRIIPPNVRIIPPKVEEPIPEIIPKIATVGNAVAEITGEKSEKKLVRKPTKNKK